MSDLPLPRYPIDKAAPRVTITRFLCPWCSGRGRWFTGERCHPCGTSGVTDDPTPGIDFSRDYGGQEPPAVEPMPFPRPPAVMRRPCVDCAYRNGAPEEGIRPGPEAPFFCHHGLVRVDGGYLAPAQVGSMPLGAMVCAGWWAQCTGEPLPAESFRDPGGADRPDAAPEQPGGDG